LSGNNLLTFFSRALLFVGAAFSAPYLSAADMPVRVYAEPTQDFATFMAELRAEAAGKGISASTIDAAFGLAADPLPRVIELDRSQPEFVQTFSGYMKNAISSTRIERGQLLMAEHRELFNEVQAKYGVQPHYLTSFWGLESNFGRNTGGFSVLNALATLAWDPRRAQMFRDQFLTALRIVDNGHITAEGMTGSWAGAMGQLQFMPDTFEAYAVDGDGDGKIDIWGSLPDVLHSAANYLSQAGWKGDERWGREVLLPKGFDFALAGTNVRKSVTEWNALGVKRADGAPLGNADIQGSIIMPAGANGPVFLGYDNFRTTMVWNRSINYAIAVGHLADRLIGDGPIRNMPVNEERPLTREEVWEMQTLLNGLGFDAGAPDGSVGSKTRDAVRDFQVSRNMTPDSYVSFDVLTALRAQAPASQE
jgi:membrane-bound lytic murein transglycosylase B